MFTIDYELRGTGWAYLTVTHGLDCRRMELSYIGPDINDLVWQTVDVLESKHEARIEFETEPGEHVWTIAPIGNDVQLTIKSEVSRLIDYASDTWEDDQWSFEALIPARDFGRAVLLAFERMLAAVGVDGYKKQWRHREPSALSRIDRLRSLIES